MIETKRVTSYYSPCRKGFWNKNAAEQHEKNCKCWTNPKFKTCKTCDWGVDQHDSNGMEHEPHNLQTWRNWECTNPQFNYDKHFKAAHEKAPTLCINCPVWNLEINEKDAA